MIRLVPKTEGGLSFDPVSSVLTACAPLFRGNDALAAEYEVMGQRGRYPVDGSYAITVSEALRRELVNQDSFRINVTLITPSGSSEIDIVVVHDLICVPFSFPPGKQGANGDFGRIEVTYPEALNPAKLRSDIVVDTKAQDAGVSVATGGRPYYGYIVTKATPELVECHGPSAARLTGSYIGTERFEDFNLDIFTTSDVSVGLADSAILLDTSEVDVVDPGEPMVPFAVFMNEDSASVPVALTQAATMLDGRVLDYVDYLKALQIICFVENFGNEGANTRLERDGGSYILNVKRVGGKWYLGELENLFWASYCAESSWVKSLFAYIKATSDEIFLCGSDGEKVGSISKQSDSQSCYALSYAYVMALMRGGTLSSAIASIQSAVSGQSAIKTDGKYIIANQSKWGVIDVRDSDGATYKVHKTGFGLATKSSQRGSSYLSGYTVGDICSAVGEGGVFIFGYDPDVTKPANNRSDHFIVVRVVNGRFVVEFDPYRVEGSTTYARRGTDVTSSADNFHESCVHIFREVVDG